jgi:hypothetical protein
MSGLGEQLAALHLLRADILDTGAAKFNGAGENKVEKLRYDQATGYFYINSSQYFEGITPEVWTYHIGGYQVCDKWLKDRKGRILSLDEIQTYCRIVTAIQKTIEIQTSIDADFDKVEANLLNFETI